MGKSQKLSFDEFLDAVRTLTNNKEPHLAPLVLSCVIVTFSTRTL